MHQHAVIVRHSANTVPHHFHQHIPIVVPGERYKLEIIEECSAPGASVAAVALSHRINANQLRKWIVQHRAGRLDPSAAAVPALLPVNVESAGRPTLTKPEPGPDRSPRSIAGLIEIELESSRIRIRGSVDTQALRAVLETLTQR